MKRIAVWNTAFLGDAVLTLPLIQSLKLRYPDADIDYYVRGGFETLFAPHPAIRQVYGFAKRGRQKSLSSLYSYGKNLAARGYDLWISAHGSARSGLAARLSGAPVRVGYRNGCLSALFYTHRVDRRFTSLEEIERLLRLLVPLGDGPISSRPRLVLDPEAAARAETFFQGMAGPALGLHPGSVWATKRWPVGNYAELGLKALETGANVLLFAGPGEEGIAGELEERMLAGRPAGRSRLHTLAGSLSLPELAAYLARLSCYVTNDSGPMHLAWTQGTPVAALFGPTVRSLGFFPRGEHSRVFETALPCRPCSLHGPTRCPLGHHQCMTLIAPETVWPFVQNVLWPPEALYFLSKPI
jgi:heptosyltransferase-2